MQTACSSHGRRLADSNRRKIPTVSSQSPCSARNPSGHALFRSSRAHFVTAFDPASGRVTGDPFRARRGRANEQGDDPIRVLTLIAAWATLLICVVPAKAAHPKKPHHSPRYLLAKQIAVGLRGTPLHGLGFVFEAEAHRAGLSPFFLVGASGTESSFGAVPCHSNPKNIWGLASCGGGIPYLETWPDAVRYFASFVRHYWPHASTVYELYGYCPPCGTQGWGNTTYGHMRELFGNVSDSLLYPRAA